MISNTQTVDRWIDKLALNLLEQKLGRLEQYPSSVIERAIQVYRPFLIAYLDIAQLQDSPTIAEQAPDFRIDKAVVDEMRHFFSDYQHLTREYIRMDNLIGRLAQTNRQIQPQRYRQVVDQILSPERQSGIMTEIIE